MKDHQRKSTEHNTMSLLEREKERWKEPHYRALYSDLLKKHRGVIGGDTKKQESGDPQDFASETALLKKALTTEREAMLYGVAAGVLAFATIRYLPRYLIKQFGGKSKIKALREADEKAKASKTGTLKNTTALFIESVFAAWVGSRGYEVASSYTEGTYELISEIPLCSGRSKVSEVICDEWISISRKEVPKEFWQNLDSEEEELKDMRTWKAIQAFTSNCIKRKAYESVLRKERGITDKTLPVVLPTKVPDNIVLSEDEVRNLVEDK